MKMTNEEDQNDLSKLKLEIAKDLRRNHEEDGMVISHWLCMLGK